jgi:hypothetical protein
LSFLERARFDIGPIHNALGHNQAIDQTKKLRLDPRLDANMKALGPFHGPISICAQMHELGLLVLWPNFLDLGPIFWHQEVAM